MKFRSKPVEIEANQFTHGATAPIGVRTREDGSCYVVTIHGEEVAVHPGDWIILEDPPGDGMRAYPCKADVFERRYEMIDSDCDEPQPDTCVECGELAVGFDEGTPLCAAHYQSRPSIWGAGA